MLLIAGIVMLIPVSEKKTIIKNKHFGIINIKSGGEIYGVNLWVLQGMQFREILTLPGLFR